MAQQITLRLSPYGVKGTAQILHANARRLSPASGLLMTTSPHLLANLRRVGVAGSISPSTELARELFHQRTFPSENGLCEVSQRYGPVGTTKSRSRPAYWLTPPTIGTLVGLAASSSATKVRILLHVNMIFCLPVSNPRCVSCGHRVCRIRQSTQR
jgi:hypothetical protein